MDLFIPPGGKTKNWYVRVYVPAELRELYGGKQEFRKSTGVTDRVRARAFAAAFALQKGQEFLRKRDSLLQPEGESLKRLAAGQPQKVLLDPSLIEKIAAARLGSLVLSDAEDRDEIDATHDWDEHDELIRTSLDDLKKIVARGKSAPGYTDFVRTACDFADVMGYDIDAHDPMLPEFIDAMVKAEKRGHDLLARRIDGEVADLAPGELGPWLRELLEGWEKEHAPADTKTRGSYKSRIEDFIAFTHDKRVVDVEKKDVWDWLNKLLHSDKLAVKTVKDGYLPALRSLFEFAALSGKYGIKMNPLASIHVPKLDRKVAAAREKPRETFNSRYINAIFESAWYSGRSQPVGRLWSKTVITGNARYWVPLISCCQGLRPEEICQLRLVDVGMQAGVFSVHITDEAGTVKNEDSQRWVPVHKVLLALGFAEYVDFQRKRQKVPEAPDAFVELGPGQKYVQPAKTGLLFPELQTTAELKSSTFLKRFNRFLYRTLSFESGYTFYSFRHYWEDTVRKLVDREALGTHPWPKGVVERMSGRTQAELKKAEGSSAEYGKPLPPNQIREYLDMVSFDNVVWPKPWGEFHRS